MKALLNKETEMEKDFRLKSESNSCRLVILLMVCRCIYLLINKRPIQWFEIAVLNILFSIRFISKMYYQKKMIGDYVFDYSFWLSLMIMIVVVTFSIAWWII